jgi:molybdate transport system regulatory protein
MPAPPTLRFRIRVLKGDVIAAGPGKVDLLEAIVATGSITAAAKELGMSYRRAWLLVNEMNRAFRSPVVEALKGGREGGRSGLTPLGEDVVRRYRAIEKTAAAAARAEIAALLKLVR